MLQVNRESEFLPVEKIGWRTSGSCLIVGAIGEKTLLDVEIPVLSLTLAGESIAQSLVVPFYQAVGLRVVGCRVVVLNLPLLE